MSNEPRFWDRFSGRMVYEALLVAESGLRVGRGSESFEPAGTDLPVLRDAEDRPFIPGSSFRGVLRAFVERVVRTFEPPARPDAPWEGRGACDPLSDTLRCVPARKVDSWRDHLRRSGDGEEVARRVWEHSCRVCRVFGSPYLASRVRIADLLPSPEVPLAVALRDGVSINREKEIVENKYDFEVVEPGATFSLRVVADNLNQQEAGLLFVGLQAAAEGQIELGGFKGRGLGRFVLREPRLFCLDASDLGALEAFLVKGGLPQVDDPVGYMRKCIEHFLEDLGGR